MKISSGKQNKAVKAVIYGPEGIGKSTLASTLPNPLFIDVEDGTSQLDVRRVSANYKTWEGFTGAVKDVLAELKKDTGLCRTLVIDTIDAAERLLTEYLGLKHKTDNIEALDYGKGVIYIRDEMVKLLKLFDEINARGVNIVLLAHNMMRKFEKPDESGAYDRYELKLTRKSAPLIKEWCDCLFFINYKTRVVSDKARGASKIIGVGSNGGDRLIYSNHHAAWDAKNRYGLGDELPLTFKSISPAFLMDVPDPKLHAEMSDMSKVDDLDPEPVFDDPDFTQINNKNIPTELVKLMERDEISEKDVIHACARTGAVKTINDEPLTDNSKLEDIPLDWVNTNLIGKWEGFKKAIGK